MIAYAADGLPLGFVSGIELTYPDKGSMPVVQIEGWYVEPTARGRKVGRALMHMAEEWARVRGFTEMRPTGEIGNEASVSAHERCGFPMKWSD